MSKSAAEPPVASQSFGSWMTDDVEPPPHVMQALDEQLLAFNARLRAERRPTAGVMAARIASLRHEPSAAELRQAVVTPVPCDVIYHQTIDDYLHYIDHGILSAGVPSSDEDA